MCTLENVIVLLSHCFCFVLNAALLNVFKDYDFAETTSGFQLLMHGGLGSPMNLLLSSPTKV